MKSKFFSFCGVTLGAFLLLTAPSFSTGISLESLSEESLPGLVQKYPQIIPHLKGLMRASPDVLFKAELGPVASFKSLDFEVLEKQFFPQGAWHPRPYHVKQEALREMFRSYAQQQSFLEDKHLIFLANVLYETGKERYKENLEDFLFLESAAAIGHPKAQLEMFGISKREDRLEEAKNYLSCSVAQGDSEALLELSKLYDWSANRNICPKNKPLAKIFCQEAALLQNPEAAFRVEVAALTEGMFGESRNFQQGVRKAKELADAGNQEARRFIGAILRSSQDALEEGDEHLTDADFDFLRSFLDWRDTWDEQDEVYWTRAERLKAYE